MSIHTQIGQPISIRKDILESAIDCVEILKTIENVKKIHHEKEIVRKKLGIVSDKLKILDARLYKNLPKLPSERRPQVEEEPQEVKTKVEKTRVKKPRSIDSGESRMSSELDALRRKIENL